MIERWNDKPGLHAVAFIRAKIAESRLLDIHPIYGGTQGTFSEHSDFPPLTSGLFVLSHVEKIELEDFAGVDEARKTPVDVAQPFSAVAIEPSAVKRPEALQPVSQQKDSGLGSPEWRKENARAAANARHNLPGGSRDKQRRIREIWASGKYSSRDLCAEQECAALAMSFTAARKALKNLS